jgi:hypothetical protein
VRLGRLVQPELVEDAGHVPLDGGHGDDQFARDAGVGEALGDQRQDLPLARGQVVERLAFRWRPTSRATTSGSSTDPPSAMRRTASANIPMSPTFSFSR